MRELSLQTKILTGPDVSDWQTFLKTRQLFSGAVDGQFGPDSDAATRLYQTNAGLPPDGALGPATLARAVKDGYRRTTGANIVGVEASVDCSLFAGMLPAAGVQFVARYYSNTSKCMTPAEARTISKQGVGLVAIFDNGNNSPGLFSTGAGKSQAAKSLALAAAMGQPPGTAIYFAADFDPKPAELNGPVADFFIAINNAFAAAAVQYAVGVRGSGFTCRTIRDSGLAEFTWLSGATGFRDYASFRPEADIVQLAPERALFDRRLTIVDDIAQKANFGAFSALGKAAPGR